MSSDDPQFYDDNYAIQDAIEKKQSLTAEQAETKKVVDNQDMIVGLVFPFSSTRRLRACSVLTDITYRTVPIAVAAVGDPKGIEDPFHQYLVVSTEGIFDMISFCHKNLQCSLLSGLKHLKFVKTSAVT